MTEHRDHGDENDNKEYTRSLITEDVVLGSSGYYYCIDYGIGQLIDECEEDHVSPRSFNVSLYANELKITVVGVQR